ncbi:MAG: hypothetical protein ATN33_05275 [Epulopiscium sp. Nele67-Bin001]|nr:MAG: hypothetical protein BEN18_00030 [Epulopiscium sp. Nuni2H_MBin001]OON93778.1 MAG: hypothetical protein ATN33_05275 [Epulopiscium sp. Nele67-Bin001]
MRLSKRLYNITKFVPMQTILADIGTDHCYIPIYLRQEGIVKHVFASDINPGPLDNAIKHINKYNITGIETRLSNGLENFTDDDSIETVIIAGMGGAMMIDILEKACLNTVKRLILQPQLGQNKVRKFLHQKGFRIIDEEFLEDEGKFYTIIVAEVGDETYSDEYFYEYGYHVVNKANSDFQKYLFIRGKTFERIFRNFTNFKDREKVDNLKAEYKIYKQTLKYIELK